MLGLDNAPQFGVSQNHGPKMLPRRGGDGQQKLRIADCGLRIASEAAREPERACRPIPPIRNPQFRPSTSFLQLSLN